MLGVTVRENEFGDTHVYVHIMYWLHQGTQTHNQQSASHTPRPTSDHDHELTSGRVIYGPNGTHVKTTPSTSVGVRVVDIGASGGCKKQFWQG